MPKVKISEYSSTANSNTDVASINIDEGCAPSGINNAIRAVMGHLKDFQTGAVSDPLTVGGALTTSSTVTHNGGTANGVAYLNGSKVLTTGSALQFDGTNLGLAVAPSGWGSGYQALQIGSTTSVYQHAGNDGRFISNGYYSTGNAPKYITTAASSMYRLADGLHYWYTAPSGTAGNAISFTQAMTLDASGNLLVGTTTATYGSSGRGVIEVNGSSDNVFAMKVAGSGNFYIQSSTSATNIWNVANAPLTFATNNTERARIDSSGKLLVGVTSPINTAHTFYTVSNSGNAAVFSNGSTSIPFGIQSRYANSDPNNTASSYYEAVSVSANKLYFEVRSNGGIANYSANNVNLSDRREKTNFLPAKSYIDVICAIPVQTYNYIDQNIEEDDGLTLGVVAQDVQAVAPELVMESNWGSKEKPKMRLSIYQTDMQYALMKCIQEQQAMIEQLKADVAALKAA